MAVPGAASSGRRMALEQVMMRHPLDRPIWSALAGRQQVLAEGDEFARRYDPDFTPFAAAADDGDEAIAALGQLVPQDGALVLLQARPGPLPTGVRAEKRAAGVQMLLEDLRAPPSIAVAIERLGEEDAPAMRALAKLTEPGPFCARTHELGAFFGIRDGGRLVAMAGERMKLDGFTEVSGVATHPDYRGRGYAAVLIARVADHIRGSGETPFLHAYAINVGAIALYRRLGFVHRCEMAVAMLVRG